MTKDNKPTPKVRAISLETARELGYRHYDLGVELTHAVQGVLIRRNTLVFELSPGALRGLATTTDAAVEAALTALFVAIDDLEKVRDKMTIIAQEFAAAQSKQLKPCPFCDGVAEHEPDDVYGDDESRRDECTKCHASAPSDIWNTRAAPKMITLDQVPAVEWTQVPETESLREHLIHDNKIDRAYRIWEDFGFNVVGPGCADAPSYKELAHAKRYVDIKVYLAAIERKLLSELKTSK